MIVSLSRIMAALMLLSLVAGNASAYGRSTEDLVGAFTLEKTIRLGSSSECFPSAGADSRSPLGQSALADDRAPSLAGFAFEPAVVLGQPVNFTAHVIDDQSGFLASESYFRSPSGETVTVRFDTQSLSSGGSKDGVYTAQMLPQELGLWSLENLTLADQEGNTRVLQARDLVLLGLPTELRVV